MTRPIFYYVHHQGRGHLDRALAVASQTPDRFVLLGTGIVGCTGPVDAIALDDDRPTCDVSATMPSLDVLHYAPLNHRGIRNRVAQIATAVAAREPALFVVDVSVEIAWLAVLASVPMVYVRLSGTRTDAAHEVAFRGARKLIAPFHAELDDPVVPRWVFEKTLYCSGLTSAQPVRRVSNAVVLVVAGAGGADFDGERLAAAARANPAYQWRCIGPVTPPRIGPANLALIGWSDHAAAEIAAAGVVIGGGGDGLVSAVLAVNRPFICLPEPRPYDEQHVKAAALERMGAAVVLRAFPADDSWQSLIERAIRLDPAVPARLHDRTGAARTANLLIELAQSA